jgi:hypothetical protein
VAARVRSIEKSNDIGNRANDLPTYSIAPQPTTLPRAPIIIIIIIIIGWRKLHNEELHKLYSSASITRINISRRTK